jgi:hypothetical protein
MLSVVFLQEPTNIKSAIPVCVIHVAVLIAKHAELSDNIFSVHFPPEIIVCLLAEKYNWGSYGSGRRLLSSEMWYHEVW